MGRYDGVSVQDLTEINRSKVLHALYREGESTRAHLARLTNLSPAAITSITGQLIDLDVVHEVGDTRGLGRRRAIGLAVNVDDLHVIGVKFGRERTEIGVFDLSGHFADDVSPVSRAWDYAMDADVSRVIDDVTAWVRDALRRDPNVVAVGMAVHGPYLADEGRISVVTGMKAWTEINFKQLFLDAFDVPVLLEHDARAGVLAERMFSSAHGGVNSLAYLLVGEGIGLGVIDHGEFVTGGCGLAGEIGHVSIDVNGRPCDCHGRGCLERYCSLEAVVDMVAERAPHLIDGQRRETRRQICGKLFEAAERDDADALEVLESLGTYLGYGCVNVVNTFNPERIVIGDLEPGRFAHAHGVLLRTIRNTVEERAMSGSAARTEVVLNDLDIDPVLCGAAAVAIQAFLDKPTRFAELRMAAEGGHV